MCDEAVPSTNLFDRAGAASMRHESVLYQRYLALFSQGHALVAARTVTSAKKVVGSIPTSLVSAICHELTEITDDADDAQVLAIL